MFHQTDDTDVSTYLKGFKHLVDVCEQTPEGLFKASGLVKYENERNEELGIVGVTNTMYKKRVKDKLTGVAFVKKANNRTYTSLCKRAT